MDFEQVSVQAVVHPAPLSDDTESAEDIVNCEQSATHQVEYVDPICSAVSNLAADNTCENQLNSVQTKDSVQINPEITTNSLITTSQLVASSMRVDTTGLGEEHGCDIIETQPLNCSDSSCTRVNTSVITADS